jgi:hypothetical protein
MSKGSARRPTDDETFRSNWEKMFGKRDEAADEAASKAAAQGMVGKPYAKIAEGCEHLFGPAKTCGSCKHWVKRHKNNPGTCENLTVINMIDSINGVTFEPPEDFSCNEWEGK